MKTMNIMLIKKINISKAASFLFILFFLIVNSFCQVSTGYTFSAHSGTFTPLTSATATDITTSDDEKLSAFFPSVGQFNFVYDGISYSQFKASSNGVLFLGTGNVQKANDLAISTTTCRPGLAVLWDDLQCSLAGVKYKITGVLPNRIMTVEWLDMEWNWASGAPAISFQVTLFESTGVIEFQYRQDADAVNSGSASIGIMGTNSTDFISLQGTGTSPTTSTITSTNTLSTKPANGQIFRFTPNCSNPTAPGVIANAQSSCGSFNPTSITSSSPASGETGTLEYKWQQSTTSAVAGFTDIPASNAATYDPPSITQTTWYKRIARVSCKTDWVGAVESNVIEMAIVSSIDLYGNPLSDTIYNQLGNVSFGVGINNPVGATYQWQVSTNGGGSWSNVTNGGVYSGATSSALQVTNPSYAMNTYQYRCVITNACGSINSPAATLTVIPTTTFSNTTTTACGTNMNNDFSFQRTIPVSGLPTTLGTSSGQYVLKQVNIQLGSSACKGDLSTYRARIISPSGTIIELFNTFTTSTGSMWTNIKYRDHVALERINQYIMNDQLAYHPHSIGYYAVQTDGSFFSVNGEDPNGNWRLEIAENIATGNEVSFQRVDLIFGPTFTYTDISSSSANDNCSTPQCISTQEIIIGTNNAYSTSEPAASFPGLTTDGCGWNGNNNNSAWFNFVASATTANITLSGIVNSTPGGNDTQPIIFSRTGDCAAMGTLTVPVGGCLDDVGDVSSVNLMAYHSSNGGGTSVINNLYANGISMNAEFQLSGLTVGQTYYLYIDGNGGTPSSFYIEALNGCQTCNTPLPVEWLSFEALKNNRVSDLYWSTATETNNDYFEVERSKDVENWEKIGQVAGAGNTSYQMDYMFTDVNPYIGINYYRIKQVDYDGNSSYSDIRAVSFTGEMMLVPNPSNGNFTVVGMPENTTNSLQLINSLGQVISIVEIQSASYSFADLNLASGIYYLTINNQETIKVCVTKSN